MSFCHHRGTTISTPPCHDQRVLPQATAEQLAAPSTVGRNLQTSKGN
jgi:hypothetical protein